MSNLPVKDERQALAEVTDNALEKKWLAKPVSDFLCRTYPDIFLTKEEGHLKFDILNMYVGLGASLGFSPLSGDLQPVPFGSKVVPIVKYTAVIRRLREDMEYISHRFTEIYEKSQVIETSDGIAVLCSEVNPGKAIGFLMEIKIKGDERPLYQREFYADWEKYSGAMASKNSSGPWSHFSKLMLKKTIFCQFIRLHFGSTLPSGVYTQEEMEFIDVKHEVVEKGNEDSTPQELPPAPERKEEKPRKAPPIRHRKPKATPAPEPAPPAKEDAPEPPAEKKPTGPAPTLFDDPLLDLRNEAKSALYFRFNNDIPKIKEYLSKNGMPPIKDCTAPQLEDIISACGSFE